MRKETKKGRFFITCLFISLFSPLAVFAQPVIVFEQDTHDFGDVMQGEDVEHTFLFQNTGSEELVIEKVSSS